MNRESYVSRPEGHDWETPGFEEIRVSAEATAYMGVQEDWE
ncbi:MAG TPA: pyrroloquinoline quinone precursor peptide PqqA [Streptosporangiaceae bacterium]|jgi:coenzyme PQQ precursor peptide PqqA|nr:pyrroloquinoline quinone precursor peptide PqqA [Streptosporangiaceae bacterium]